MILDSDWSQYKFLIAVNTNDQIEVIFEDISSQNIDLITCYMNSLINDERITQYQLKKVID